MPEYESEADVLNELVREFPAVPARIIAQVLSAYLEPAGDLGEAARVTRKRIHDALAG